jgi:uncharacterized membrane protein
LESRVKLFGHPIHPMLIVFPLGLLATSVVFDIVHFITANGQWAQAAFFDIAAGIVGGLLAALFGLLDWLHIPGGTRAKSVGLWHGGGNVVVVILFAISFLLRLHNPPDPGVLPFIFSIAGAGLAAVTGWLGGELVDRLGVGVDTGAHLDAPNSLSGRPVSARRQPT